MDHNTDNTKPIIRWGMRSILVLALLAMLVWVVGYKAPSLIGSPATEQVTADDVREGQRGFQHRGVDRPAPVFSLVDQNGQSFNLADFRGKWVAMDFIYTHCATACPLINLEMTALKGMLGDRLGPEVQMVSVTIDPARDTPEIMKAYAQKFRADVTGWAWVTGTRSQIDEVTETYGVAVEERWMNMPMRENADDKIGVTLKTLHFQHPVLMVLIDPKGRERHRFTGLGWSEDLLETINKLASG